jgi:hypothetical protein
MNLRVSVTLEVSTFVTNTHHNSGTYPEYITVIGYEMKRKRFEDLHSNALRWPRGKFEYIGIDANFEKGMGSGNEGEVTLTISV